MERTPEAELRRFFVLSADIEAHGHSGGCPGCAALATHGNPPPSQKKHNNECRERIRTIIERTLTETARMNAYQHRVAETERLLKDVQGMPMEPGNEEHIADRHAVACGEEEKQHEENIMRDIHIGERGSETGNEEQPDKLRKTVRFEQEAPNTSSSSTMHVSLEHPADGEGHDRPEPILLHTKHIEF